MRRTATLVIAAAVVIAGCQSGTDAVGPVTPATVATGSPVTTPVPVPAAASTAPAVPATTLPAGDSRTLAASIVAAERTIRDPNASPDAVAAAGRVQQRAYRRLGANPTWEADVTAAVPAALRPAYDANLAAATIARRLAEQAAATSTVPPEPTVPAVPTTRSPSLPAWTIRAPKSTDELLGDYHEAEAATGVPWYYLAAINFVETRMGRIVGVSSAGAEGPMQFLPDTWAACCHGDVWDDHDAFSGAASYLASNGAPGDMAAAVWRYNPNEVYLEMVTQYASVMAADELAYRGYHAWEVFYGSAAGDVRLPEGYTAAEPVDASTYVTAHPDDRVAATFP
jgi:hypothetical protein